MLAIPVFRERVAPVLNWCTKVLVFPDEEAQSSSSREIILSDPNPFDLLQILHKEGVSTLICGALSSEVLGFGEHLGMQIIHGVAGDISEVLRAYHEKCLDQPSFRLPGCMGRPRCKGGNIFGGIKFAGRGTMAAFRGFGRARGGKKAGQDMQGDSGLSRMQGGAVGDRGSAGVCICPNCGLRVPHKQGIPCAEIRCSKCNATMVRE